MKKILILLSILVLLPQVSNAGVKRTVTVVGGGIILKHYGKRMVTGAISLSAGYATHYVMTKLEAKNLSKEYASIYKKEVKSDFSKRDEIAEILLNEARTNTGKYNVPLMILDELDWIDSKNKRNIRSDNKIYKEAFDYLLTLAYEDVTMDANEYDNKCKDPNSSDALLLKKSTKKINNLEPFMVDRYQRLSLSEKRKDKLEHDHIPSDAAVKLYLERKKGLQSGALQEYYRNIRNNAIAIEIPELLHASGRTFKGKNTYQKIELDSRNLLVAFIKDYTKHFLNLQFKKNRTYQKDGAFGMYEKKMKLNKSRSRLIKAMKKHFKLNMELCLYEKI